MKVYIQPNWIGKPDKGEGGIRRVTEYQIRLLPEFGIEIATNPNEADVINTHGDQIQNIPGIPVVHSGHGLYWSRYPWGTDFQDVNKRVVNAMRHAVAHTCPSEWVATSVRRGMLVYPEVVFHGVDASEWEHDEEVMPYVLWNKARTDFVSNARHMNDVAKLLPARKFVSTFGQRAQNVELIGKTNYEEMKKYVKKAGVYLCTTRETFGINTLEALAAGVPVAGFDWGGQKEIILQGKTGYLVKPGDFKALAEAIERCFTERDRLSANCIADARERWRWLPRIKQYADIYKRVYKYYNNPRPKVSVIVATHNLDKYLPDCLASVQAQTFEDWECIVVDSLPSEDTERIVLGWQEKDNRFKYRRDTADLGLPGTRNFGLKYAKALYIHHLDADDKLTPNTLALYVEALDKDWGTHIVYGHLENIKEDGSPDLLEDGSQNRLTWPPQQYSWRQQMAHLNQLPSTVMVRRCVYENAGGYRTRMKRAEDAELWCRVTSLGFKAKKITQAVTIQHRQREDSKGMLEWKQHGQEPDWTAWFPWRMGAGDYSKGHQVVRELGRRVPNHNIVPFGAQGEPPPEITFWPVHDYAYPTVSIIVTVGPHHEKYIKDALDSIWAQNYPDWECIVVNDTGKEWNMKSSWNNPLTGFPWARYVSTKGNFGVSRARNTGAQEAKANLFVWLDVDDYWMPWYLERMVAMAEENNGIIYSDFFLHKKGEELEIKEYPEFDCQMLTKRGMYPGSSVLVPRWVHDIIMQKQQGWDENIPGMEDYDYQLAAAVYAEVCAYRVPEPLFVYRFETGINREAHWELTSEIAAYMDTKWPEYRKGQKKIMCGCSKKKIKRMPNTKFSSTGAPVVGQNVVQADFSQQTVVLSYEGPQAGTHTRKGKATGRAYRFGNNQSHKFQRVYVEDARMFMSERYGQNPLFKLVETEVPVAQDVKDFLLSD